MLDQGAAKKACLLQFADGGAPMKGVVTHRFDRVENGDAASAEHFEVDAQPGINHFCKRQSFSKQFARARYEILHQADVAIIETPLDDIVFAKTLGRGRVERNVDAALIEVARNVLPEVRELKRSASCIGKALTLLVAVAAEV